MGKDRMEEEPRRRGSGLGWMLALLPMVALAAYIFYYLHERGREPAAPETPAINEFNLAERPDVAPDALAGLPPGRGPAASPKAKGPGLRGFMIEKDRMFKGDAKGRKRDEWEQMRAREKAYIKKHDGALREEQARLALIAARYYAKYPIVREVDRAFAKNSKYMAIAAKYGQDRDPYEFARAAVSEPSVRATIRKYSTNPEVWKVTLAMAQEALKDPPPKAVYKEMVRFLTKDKKVSGFLQKYAKWMTPKVPTIATQAIPEGMNLAPIESVMNDLSVPGVGRKKKRRRRRR